MKTEIQSIGQIAVCFLSKNHEFKLPKTLHDALNNIFTKGTGDAVKYQKEVIYEEGKVNGNSSFAVIKGKKNAIHNSLCLYALLGTGDTKKLFQHYYSTKQFPAKRDFSILKRRQTQHYLEYSCFGVSYENIKLIEQCLVNENFDLFTDKLPSPYAIQPGENMDLSPMLEIYGKGIPWDRYMEIYKEAEKYYEKRDYKGANKLLDELEQETVIHLPIVEFLKRKITAEIDEANEAMEYLQQILK